MSRYRVAEATQVNIDGTVHEAGATVEATGAEAERMVRMGWLEAVEDKDKAAPKRRPARAKRTTP